MKLHENGVYLLNGTELIEDNQEAAACLASKGVTADRAAAAKGTMAYRILEAHNTSGNMEQLQIKFDKLTSHDIYIRRYYPDGACVRAGEVPGSLRADQLP